MVNTADYAYFTSPGEGEEENISGQPLSGFGKIDSGIISWHSQKAKRRHSRFSFFGSLVGYTATGSCHAIKFAVEGMSESLLKEVALIVI